MELERYVNGLRDQLLVAAEAGGRRRDWPSASWLPGVQRAPDPAGGLSDAANEITLELAPGSVEVRVRGRDPELVVTPPPTAPTAPSTTVDDVG